MTETGVLIGVDVGGTFTDAVVIDGGRAFRAKSPSTYPEVGRGVLAACRLAAEAAGRDFAQLLPQVKRFGLGTTAVTNVIATRRGLKVGLITTRGFEETVRLARARVETVDGWRRTPESLVDQAAVVGVNERIDRTGEVLTKLDPDEVLAAGRYLVDEAKVDSIAVSYLWSFLNPVHEDLTVDLLRKNLQHVQITGGAALRPVIREYERTTLAVLNSYSFGAYTGIELLADELKGLGLKVPVLLCHSGGGTISIGQAREQPVWLAESGPAAGVAAAAVLAQMAGAEKALTCDLGGTSFDVSHLENGAPARVQRGDLMGMWTALPRVDVESVGAGGGSVGWVDERGMLRVGPRSVGSFPGPACYGRGGQEPALTDALVVLGYIDPNRFLGGRMTLDREASIAACERVGAALGFDAVETAWGMREIALAEMAKAARGRLATYALNAAEHALISYGGCGSLFTLDVARAIDVPRVLVPELASVLSAFGAATMDVRRERVRSLLHHLPGNAAFIEEAFRHTHDDVLRDLAADAVAPEARHVYFEADMRFAGQRWELTIPLPADVAMGDGGAEIEAIFRREYLHRYGPSATGQGGVVELVALRAIGIGAAGLADADRGADAAQLARQPATPDTRRPVHLRRGAEPTLIDAYDGAALQPGATLIGPALIDGSDTTIWIPEGVHVHTDAHRTLIAELKP
jgi:N-methylhydantoinase A